jgi:hypothetical protein
LAPKEPVKAELVKLRYVAGLTVPEAARLLGVSAATAERYWTYARTWLYCALNEPAREARELAVTPEEYARVIGTVEGPCVRDLIEMAWETGSRG